MGVKHQTCGHIVDVVQNLPFSMTNLWHLPEARLEQPGKVGKLEWETQDMQRFPADSSFNSAIYQPSMIDRHIVCPNIMIHK